MPVSTRPLHFVFKIGNRRDTMNFYTNILGMKILRHEEFEEGCDAKCNGPYDGKWSKTMVGYGDEDSNFVIELTYNYGIRAYLRGNDFNFIKINSNQAIANLKEQKYPFMFKSSDIHEVTDPNGYKFLIGPNINTTNSLITGLSLFITDVKKSAEYWINELNFNGKTITENDSSKVELSFSEHHFTLWLEKTDKIDRAKAYGRTAFSCPDSELKPLQTQMESKNLTILTPYIRLDTPGKASVCVVILADPDGHEICFVNDESFRLLSQFDKNAHTLLDEAIKKDKSDEWHEKKALKEKS